MRQRALVFPLPLLAVLLLSACGSGSESGAVSALSPSPGIAVGEPSPSAPVVPAPPVVATADFISMARSGGCSDVRNRLYVIDGKQVFRDVAGNCADASYSYSLYGAKPETILCSSGDSIAGPRTVCPDESARALFDTIVKNRDQPDLGLGAGHKVEALTFLPNDGALLFELFPRSDYTGVKQAKNVVVKDSAAWNKLWQEMHQQTTPVPALPPVDFAKQMIVAVFRGEAMDGCHTVKVLRTAIEDNKIRVEYALSEQATLPGADDAVFACTQAITTSASLAIVDRLDGEVEFASVAPAYQSFATVDKTTNSGITRAQTVVIKDAASWAELWQRHSGKAPLPAVDFGKSMVVGIFSGEKPGGCYDSEFTNVYRLKGKEALYVEHTDNLPGPAVLCIASITSPAHLITVARTDAPVTFVPQWRTLGGKFPQSLDASH
ncbi:MAG: protease complex subunit PrcB family protein [Pseudomonadota bacterium]